MLYLTRREGEEIRLELPDGREATIVVRYIKPSEVKLGLRAPQDVIITRPELDDREVATCG